MTELLAAAVAGLLVVLAAAVVLIVRAVRDERRRAAAGLARWRAGQHRAASTVDSTDPDDLRGRWR